MMKLCTLSSRYFEGKLGNKRCILAAHCDIVHRAPPFHRSLSIGCAAWRGERAGAFDDVLPWLRHGCMNWTLSCIRLVGCGIGDVIMSLSVRLSLKVTVSLSACFVDLTFWGQLPVPPTAGISKGHHLQLFCDPAQ